MPHNIHNFSPPPRSTSSNVCEYVRQVRIANYVNNHVYMESTLQPTYTMATYFLFQNGIVRDVLNQSSSFHPILAFDANRQCADVYVFIPWLNVLLTLAGCVLVGITVMVVILWRCEVDPLEHITEPHTIANVLLNEQVYPPLLLSHHCESRRDRHTDDLKIQALHFNTITSKPTPRMVH